MLISQDFFSFQGNLIQSDLLAQHDYFLDNPIRNTIIQLFSMATFGMCFYKSRYYSEGQRAESQRMYKNKGIVSKYISNMYILINSFQNHNKCYIDNYKLDIAKNFC